MNDMWMPPACRELGECWFRVLLAAASRRAPCPQRQHALASRLRQRLTIPGPLRLVCLDGGQVVAASAAGAALRAQLSIELIVGPTGPDNVSDWIETHEELEKGTEMAKEPTTQVAFRLPDSLIARLDRHVERMTDEGTPGARFSRADAVRSLRTRAGRPDRGSERAGEARRTVKVVYKIIYPNGKRSWMGAITESDVKPLGWWCSMAINNKRPFCEREGQHCEKHRTMLKDIGTTSEPCHMQPTAHCFVRRFEGDRMSICFPDEPSCELVHNEVRDRETDCTERH